MMKKKIGIIVLLLLLTVGFASVTTSLLINGTTSLGYNNDNFDIYFSRAIAEEDGSADIDDTTRKTITYSTKVLNEVNDEAMLEYTINNDSTQYNARGTVQFECDNGLEDYVTIQMLGINDTDPVTIEAGSSRIGKIKIKLKQRASTALTFEFTVTLSFDPVERNETATIDNRDYLKDLIINGNNVHETTNTMLIAARSSDKTHFDDGLYELNINNVGFGGTNDGGKTYYFHGDVTNNVVEFANHTWRIVRINEDGTIRLILDKGIYHDTNDEFNYDLNFYNNNDSNDYHYMYYSNTAEEGDPEHTNAKYTVDKWYDEEIVDKGYDSKVATGNYFCEAAKVAESDGWNQEPGTTFMTVRREYTPTLDCVMDDNGYQFVPGKVGLITYDEVVLAGGLPYTDENDIYYLRKTADNQTINYIWWTMSPGGLHEYTEDHTQVYVWAIQNEWDLNEYYAKYGLVLRPVINLVPDVRAVYDSSTGHYVVD